MTASPLTWIETWRQHIHALAVDIGPRGSTTPAEKRAADYCADMFNRFGLIPRLESFTSARSIFQPHFFAAEAMLFSFAIYPLFGPLSALIAALLSGAALACELLELGFRENPLRRLVTKGSSQNVFATLDPSGENRQDIILIGHLDTQRTPLIFRSPKWVSAYQLFTTVAFVAFALQVILFGMGIFTQWPWIWPVTIFSAVCALLLIGICLQADASPFTAGANDNASAVGLVLTLARFFQENRLQNSRLWFTCTGCEEVQHYGAIDFFRRHGGEFHRPKAIAFELMGCAGPAWVTQEGIIIPFQASREMTAIAEAIAHDCPEWQAYPCQVKGGNTEMADALRVKIPAIAFFGLTRQGIAPYWHQLQDTYDKMDPEVLARNFAFSLEFIRRLDQAAG
jgi:hypothetical protein